ncbi:LysE family transporter [Aliikangiella sp. GXAS 311]|uniref:LysE family transporter n=3 Tax=Aliikangiella maris TaxID=3162458 RepID=A0ABV2BZA3_9GAMM
MIIPIGAQNTFVLNQALKRNYPFLVAGICVVCDIFLVIIGVYGGGIIFNQSQLSLNLLTWGGIFFLTVYGSMALADGIKKYRTLLPKTQIEDEVGNIIVESLPPRKKPCLTIIFGALAVTLLNPHVYLDTIVILGSVGNQYTMDMRGAFVAGCIIASISWFYALTYGAIRLADYLIRPKVQVGIDIVVALTMWMIAFSLLNQWAK